MRRLLAFGFVFSIVAAGCSSESFVVADSSVETTVRGAPTTTVRFEPTTTGSVGSTIDDPLVTFTAGPDVWINPEHALIEIPGGRWGDDPLLLTTSGTSPGSSGFQSSIAPETTGSCELLAEMIQGLEIH